MVILSYRHTHIHPHIVLCPGNTPCHLSQQSCTPGASLILMNSRFSHNCPSPGLWENKHSGTGLIWLHCHHLYRLVQSRSYNTHSTASETLAVTTRFDQKGFKSLPQVLRLRPARNSINDEIAFVFDWSNSRHLGSHPGKYWAAAAPSKSKGSSSSAPRKSTSVYIKNIFTS